MELDTGAAVSIISEKTRQALFADMTLRRSTLRLKTYTEEQMQVTGQLHVVVQYGSQQEKLVLIVVSGNGPSLFGRKWLKYLRLDWPTIATVNAVRVKPLQVLLKEHPQLVAEGLGKVEPYRANALSVWGNTRGGAERPFRLWTTPRVHSTATPVRGRTHLR